MKPGFILVLAVFLALAAGATGPAASAQTTAPDPAVLQILPADSADLTDFLWTNRVVVVFADTPADPAYIEQLRLLTSEPVELLKRDVVVVTDSTPATNSALRRKLRPRGFSLIWIDKDGALRLRKPAPLSVRELAHAIDKTPLRIEEMAGSGR